MLYCIGYSSLERKSICARRRRLGHSGCRLQGRLVAILSRWVTSNVSESIKQLLSSINLIGKHAVMFADDFDFVDNETIVFSDLAAGCPLHDLFMCLYGGVKSSRYTEVCCDQDIQLLAD